MQNIFTFTAKIDRGCVGALQKYLDQIQDKLLSHPDMPFKKLTKVHFTSMLIVSDPAGDFDPYFVFENNIDGTIAAYIEQLCDVAHRALHAIFSNCVGYDARAYERATLRAYLWKHLLRPKTAFVGNVGRDVARIHAERALARDIGNHVDKLVAGPRRRTGQQIYNSICDQGALGWARQPQGRLPGAELALRRLAIALVGWCALAMTPVLVPLLSIWVIVLRIHEMRDRSLITSLPPDRLAAVTGREDQIGQNHFASVSVVKPGLFRQVTLRAVLFAINLLARLQINGTLTNLDNIHFAHWVLIDRGRRLMFLTNYDGSWENYLDDFIDKAASGITAIWSNVENFPKTWLLVRGGCRNERAFKTIARHTQVPTAVWYSAYRGLTVPSIQNNSAIRDAVATPPVRGVDFAWLQRL